MNYRRLFEAIPGFCAVVLPDDPRFTLVAANGAWLRLIGKSHEEVVGSGLFDIVPEAPPLIFPLENLRASFRRVLAAGQPDLMPAHQYDLPHNDHKSGFEERFWSSVNSPVFDTDGSITHLIHRFEDITERKRTEERLRKTTVRLEEAHAAAELGMWSWDVQADCLVADRNLAFLFGIDERQAARGMSAEPFIRRVHPEDQPVMRERLASTLERGETYSVEYRVASADGTERWVASRGRATFDTQGKPQWLNGIVLDVTERRRAEEALRNTEERLGFALEAGGGVGTWDWDVFADRVYSKGRFAELYSIDPARAAAGTPLSEFVASIHPEDRARVGETIQRALESGDEFRAEYRLVQQDGSVRWVDARGRCHRDAKGKPTRFPGVIFDITERKRIEQELHQRNNELAVANRGLEEFAHVASHDLQEPLRMVNSYSQLLVRRLGDQATDEQKQFANFIRTGVRRMEQLIKDLLFYSRTVHITGETSEENANLEEALRHALTAVDTRSTETRAAITSDSLPVVRGDTMQLSHVFQNLLSNALKYYPSDRQPQIHINALRQEGHWIISVRDNGIGFEPLQAERIFGLFKRLHREEEYPGTGLGLAICKRIVERYGGRMWAEGEPEIGSTFFFSLKAV